MVPFLKPYIASETLNRCNHISKLSFRRRTNHFVTKIRMLCVLTNVLGVEGRTTEAARTSLYVLSKLGGAFPKVWLHLLCSERVCQDEPFATKPARGGIDYLASNGRR